MSMVPSRHQLLTIAWALQTCSHPRLSLCLKCPCCTPLPFQTFLGSNQVPPPPTSFLKLPVHNELSFLNSFSEHPLFQFSCFIVFPILRLLITIIINNNTRNWARQKSERCVYLTPLHRKEVKPQRVKGVAQGHRWFRWQGQNSKPVLLPLNCNFPPCWMPRESGTRLEQAHQNWAYDKWLTFGLAWEAQYESGRFKNTLTEQMPSELYFISLLHSKHEVTTRPEKPDQGLPPYLAALTNNSCTRWCKFRKETRNPQSGSDAFSPFCRPKPQDGWRQRRQINSLCLEAAFPNPWQFWPAASAGWPWCSHGGLGGTLASES